MDYNQLANMPFNTGALMLNAAQQADMQRNIALIARYNQDPYSLSKEERARAKYYAQQYGLDTSGGDYAKNASIGRQALALGGGLLDALLFGILKDSWYSNEDTKTAKNIGKAVGLLASFLLPWSFLNATKGAKAAIGGAKALTKGAKAGAGVAKAGKSLQELFAGKSLQELFGGAKALSTGAKAASSQSFKLSTLKELSTGAKALQKLFGRKYLAKSAKRTAKAAKELSIGAKALDVAKSIGSGAKAALATNAAVRELYANMSASQALAEIAKALVRGSQIAGVTQEFLNPLMNQQEEIDMMYPMTAYGMPMLPQ